MDGLNYIPQYKKIIELEKRIPRARIKPHNIYRISKYNYVSGDKRKLSGEDSTLIFVTGIFNETVYGLKLNNLNPNTFFKWASKIVKNKKILNESDNNLYYFSDIAPILDRNGQRVYDSYIKSNPLLKQPDIPYRAYKLDGVKYISEIFIKKEILKSYYE